MTDIPVVLGAQGATPTPPAALLAALLALVTQSNPGYTANLPGSLIEDISSTDVGALTIIDQIRVELINSLTPYGANQFLLNQLGQIYGVEQGVGSNTSVFVVFSGTVSFVIAKGFVVSDGTYQYVVQDGGIVGGSGSSTPLFCVATTSGTFSAPANTVIQLVTSIPDSVTLTCNNPQAGVPGAAAQTEAQYRAQVLQAGLAVAQGMPSFLRTLLENVSGVQARLVSIRPAVTSGFWEIIVGGGDPYEIAYAIFSALFDITTIVGSSDTSRNITTSILDYPDVYPVIFVNPPQQNITMTVTWNTSSVNVVSPTAVATLAASAISDYINSIYVGQPINLLVMQETFQVAVASVLPASLITVLDFAVSIDGTPTPPDSGTQIIVGDPESYFSATPSSITVTQG